MMRDFQTLLPPNSTPMERALEKSIFRATNLDVDIANLWDVDRLDESLLPYLAWTVGVELWSDELKPSEKRNLIREYLVIRSLRGTKEAITRAYGVLGVVAEIEENPLDSEGVPMPYVFRLKISGQPVSRQLYDEIIRMTNLLKPLRTIYFFEIEVDLEMKVGFWALQRITSVARFKTEIT